MIDYAKPKQINFFIIAQAQRCVWALLILWAFCMQHVFSSFSIVKAKTDQTSGSLPLI